MPHIQHLSKDKKLARLVAAQQKQELAKRNQVHLRLCASIMSQQLSVKVAAVIYARFLQLFPKKTPSAKDIAAVSVEQLRSIGLSNAKAAYVLNVCNFFIENKVTDARLHRMEDEELISFLTQIKGVGRWTAEMILMFTLGREDVMALDDLGIQQAMINLYQLENLDKKMLRQKMTDISNKWKPYRTYACKYLWGWKDGGNS